MILGKGNLKIFNAFDIKLIALTTMIIDHVGVVFFPDILELRIIGRIAFILYAFMLTEGVFYTSNLKNYRYKVAYWAILSEVPYDLAIYKKWFYFGSQNIFFALLIAIIGLEFFEKNKGKILPNIIVGIACIVSAYILKVDYSWYGVALIFIFYWIRNIDILKFTLIQTISFKYSILQVFSFVGFIPIILYNGKLGKKIGNIYYSFYAIHLYILFFIRDFII